jgi:hypothetical protein
MLKMLKQLIISYYCNFIMLDNSKKMAYFLHIRFFEEIIQEVKK